MEYKFNNKKVVKLNQKPPIAMNGLTGSQGHGLVVARGPRLCRADRLPSVPGPEAGGPFCEHRQGEICLPGGPGPSGPDL